MTTIFIANVHLSTSSSDLRSLFECYGQVLRVSRPMDRETGKPKSFAFVEMADSEQAQTAIERLQGHDLAGRKLDLAVAKPRKAEAVTR